MALKFISMRNLRFTVELFGNSYLSVLYIFNTVVFKKIMYLLTTCLQTLTFKTNSKISSQNYF